MLFIFREDDFDLGEIEDDSFIRSEPRNSKNENAIPQDNLVNSKASFSDNELMKNMKFTIPNPIAVKNNEIPKKPKNVPFNSSKFKIPKTNQENTPMFEQTTQLNYDEDSNVFSNLDLNRHSRHCEEPNYDRNFIKIFGGPCFNFLKNSCTKSHCEYSHRNIPNVHIKEELKKVSSHDIINIFRSVCFFPSLVRINLAPFLEVPVERKEANVLIEEWRILSLSNENSTEWPLTSLLTLVLKEGIKKMSANDIITFFSSICGFPEFLYQNLSPFVENLVERKDTSTLLELYKVVNSTQERSFYYIIPFQKAFEACKWPATNVLRRMYISIRSLPNINPSVLDYFFDYFRRADTFSITELMEILNHRDFVITVNKMNQLTSEYVKTNQTSNVAFGQLLIKQLLSIREDIQNAPNEEKVAITNFLEKIKLM